MGRRRFRCRTEDAARSCYLVDCVVLLFPRFASPGSKKTDKNIRHTSRPLPSVERLYLYLLSFHLVPLSARALLCSHVRCLAYIMLFCLNPLLVKPTTAVKALRRPTIIMRVLSATIYCRSRFAMYTRTSRGAHASLRRQTPLPSVRRAFSSPYAAHHARRRRCHNPP